MKKLGATVAAVMFLAQIGYCAGAGSAFESLKTLGSVEDVSISLPSAPVKAMNGNAFKTDQALSMMRDIPGETPFEKLKNLYDGGTPATEKDLTGWYSGRMVVEKNPEVLFGALLVGKRVSSHPGGGPLFENDKAFQVVPLYNPPGWGPDCYDNMDTSLISRVKDWIENPMGAIALAFPLAEGTIQNSHGRTTISYRRAKDYIAEYLVTYDVDGKQIQKAYSYYFLNVTPKN